MEDSARVVSGTISGGIKDWEAVGSSRGCEVLGSAGGGGGNTVGSVGSAGVSMRR